MGDSAVYPFMQFLLKDKTLMVSCNHFSGLALNFFSRWPAGPPEHGFFHFQVAKWIFRWPKFCAKKHGL